MTNDQKASIAGLISALGMLIASFLPQAGETIQQVAAAISAIAISILGWYTNRAD